MSKTVKLLRGGLLPFAAVGYIFLALWTQAHVSPSDLHDAEIFFQATTKALRAENPYQPVHVGYSFVYPPSGLLLFTPLVRVSPGMAQLLWTALNVVLYFCALAVIWQLVRPKLEAYETIWVGGVLLFYAPLLETWAFGQVNCLILLGLVLFIWGLVDQRYAWIGDLGLAAVILIKMTPALLLAIPLVHKDWRRCGRVLLGLAVPMLLSIAVFGITPWLDFIEILPELFQGVQGMFNQALAPSLAWLFRRIAPQASQVPLWIGRAFTVATLGGWVVAVVLLRRRTDRLALANLGVVTMTIGSSLIWYHHLVFLVFPIVYLTLSPEERRPAWVSPLVWLALGLIQADRIFEAPLKIPPFLAISGYLLIYAASIWAARRE